VVNSCGRGNPSEKRTISGHSKSLAPSDIGVRFSRGPCSVLSGRSGCLRGCHEYLTLAADVGPAGLIDEFGHADVSEIAEPCAELIGGSAACR
jgi:hypothetical protein